jgi:putative membrane protein insertion efficiency factor
MVRFLRALIWLYRMALSPMLGANCRFEPSCAVYADEALRRFGVWRGGMLALQRIGRCHPWHDGGHDPVPTNDFEIRSHGSAR